MTDGMVGAIPQNNTYMTELRGMRPLIVTLDELTAILQPITMGYTWGEATIHDLWKIGAPTPDSTIHYEKRIVFPGQLAKWLKDVLTKQGHSLDDMADTYIKLLQVSN